ncbi:MAG TPA: type II toxin-antitoxin system RelE/ParE family toxin [Gemmatimonadales bacterium]|jgi:hypothetical protein|nr:type II toxin-antitoxin system RelE/ParE family toxin [Gemmatimonadales bacterium]
MGNWSVEYDDAFYEEVTAHAEAVQVKLAAMAKVLEEFGPQLGRPLVDTLKGSKHANMKELRFKVAKETWRVAFAFDPRRSAILLAGGGKQGVSERIFYAELIRVADERFDRHLARRRQRGE